MMVFHSDVRVTEGRPPPNTNSPELAPWVAIMAPSQVAPAASSAWSRNRLCRFPRRLGKGPAQVWRRKTWVVSRSKVQKEFPIFNQR